MNDFIYPNIDRLIEIHDLVLLESEEVLEQNGFKSIKPGGLPGIKNIGALESILTHIQNDFYYPKLEDKATHLCFEVNKGHAFEDGNKRTSLVITLEFLTENNSNPGNFLPFMENIAIAVTQNVISKNLLKEILIALIYDNLDSKEWLKLDIFNALEESLRLKSQFK